MSDQKDGNGPPNQPRPQTWVERIAAERGQNPAQPLPDWRSRILHERENAQPPSGPSRQRWLPQEQNTDLAKQVTRPPPSQPTPPQFPPRGRER